MFEIWMQTGALLALGVFAAVTHYRLKLCEHEVVDLGHDIEKLTLDLRELQPKPTREMPPVSELEWLPPSLSQPLKAAPMPTLTMKHREIKS